ncbi:SGNH/GDSL hydrolase family protein [Alteribacter aurantiacus]|uniref:SGNH/GDSL hydrolase family protein n=1 Tax=Alteribacter aurantiacus TaxID=254410 RepID=UPI0004035D57|nr:SGNH/GDSL hydrolase family protein [Alteribacter aurantiacus]
MYKGIFAIILLVSIGTVIFGKFHYDQKLLDISAGATEVTAAREQKVTEDSQVAAEPSSSLPSTDMEPLVASLPEQLGDMITNAYKNNEKLTLVSVGSGAIIDYHEEGIVPWTDRIIDKLNEHYGNFFESQVASFGDMHSLNFIINEHHKEVAKLNGEIYLIEPLIGNNLYRVGTDEAIIHLRNLISEIKEENPDSYIILQPSQPIPNVANLSDHMAEVASYAREASISYIDHWQDWPSYNDDELLRYIEDHGYPNQEGHDLWAERILSWFKVK